MPWAAAAAVVAGSVISSSSAKAGVKAQEKQNERSEAFIREQAINARNDAIPLYNAAQENRGIGTQAALDVFEETVPEQGRLFTAGNMAAQGTMLSGLEQSNNAILGMPVDYSGLQPQEFTPNYGFLEQGIPEFSNPELRQRLNAGDAVGLEGNVVTEAELAAQTAALTGEPEPASRPPGMSPTIFGW
mgnify:FL=1|tara:strand:+ start:12112 stop:12675 length:564 start_codon:yes stop_codon:yes gene_type:complete